MSLIDKIDPGSGFVPSAVRVVHIVGTPVDSAVSLDDGELIPDEYTLTLSAVSAGTGTVTVDTGSINNPFNGAVFTGVALDGSTERTDIVPGLTLIFDNAGANGQSSTIYVGSYFGTISSIAVGDGLPATGIRHQVLNTSVGTVTNAKARILTQSIQVKKTGSAFSYVANFADGATEKVAGAGSYRIMPYVVAVKDITGTGDDKTASVYVDLDGPGALTIKDRTTGEHQTGVDLRAVEGQQYEVVSGPLKGLIFAIDPDCAEDDDANILIFSNRYAEIAPDDAGSEGTYGNSDVDLTETGFATGVITPNGVAYYWVRVRVPGSSNNESNPYLANVALTGEDSGSAGW